MLRYCAALVSVALAAAAFAIAFRFALVSVLHAASGADDVVTAFTRAPRYLRVLIPPIGGLAAGLLGMAIRKESGHGVGDVMEAVVLGRVRLAMRTTFVKSIASWCAITSGGSLGREGPLIQFGGAAGKVFGKRFGLSSKRTRVLIAAGTAAGFASAYNTPFAAVLFVLEVVAGVIVLDTLVPTLIATVIATLVTRAVVGSGPIYGERAFFLRTPAELVAFLGLGALAALAAQLFMRLLSFSEALFRQSRVPFPWRPAVGGLLAGVVVLFLPEVAGNGYEPLDALLDARFSVSFVAILLACKVIATCASVSSGSPGGVFTPALLIGGAVGFLFGAAAHGLGLAVGPPAGYALVGMAAATAATTHAPLMAAVMVFELSGDYAIVLPLVLATAVATATSRSMRRDSIYGAELRRRGIGWRMTLEGRRVDDR